MLEDAQLRSPISHEPDPPSREPEMSRLCRELLRLSWVNMLAHGTQPRVIDA
jgi:hypothetical protein